MCQLRLLCRIFIALVLVIVIVIVPATVAQASTVDFLRISASVQPLLTARIQTSSSSLGTQILTDGSETEVAQIFQQSNTEGGYVIFLSSLNNGSLNSTDQTGPSYTATLDSDSVSLSQKDVPIFTGVASNLPSFNKHSLKVNCTQDDSTESTKLFTDTLTLSIMSL